MQRSFWLIPVVIACGSPPQPSDASQDVSGAASFFTETTGTALGAQPCGPGQTEGCYSNYVAVADLANGGDHFVAGEAVKSVVYFGDGAGAFKDGTDRLKGLAPSHVRQVAIGDVD